MIRPKAIAVEPYPDYCLLVTFSNNEKRLFDVKPYLDFKPFSGNSGNTFPLLLGHKGQSFVRWTGSGNRPVVLAGNRGYHLATVNFSNGNATVPYSNFRELPD